MKEKYNVKAISCHVPLEKLSYKGTEGTQGENNPWIEVAVIKENGSIDYDHPAMAVDVKRCKGRSETF